MVERLTKAPIAFLTEILLIDFSARKTISISITKP